MERKSEQKPGSTTRRGFLAGMAAGIGAVAAVASSAGRAKAAAPRGEAKASGPVLYRRSAEAERYYKTLYT